ncbi:TOMM precursor leader peptide-binding protein [Dermacoccaceae bacterium W4C1]
MTYKTRPDLHFAPLPDGVFVSAGDREFALAGWAGFANLLRTCLPLLDRGSGEDELVQAVGTERARPAVRHLLSQLDAHGMVLDLDRISPPPEAEEAGRHPELLAYLECRAAEPYSAYRTIRDTRVLLVGPDGAEETLAAGARAVDRLGMEHRIGNAPSEDGTETHQPDHDLAVVMLSASQAQSLTPRTNRFLPIVLGHHRVLVGPVVDDLRGWGRWRELTGRVLSRSGAATQASGPAATVAISAAVHLLLQRLAETAGPQAYSVDVEELSMTPLDLPPTVAVPGPISLTDATDDVASLTDLSGWLGGALDPVLGCAATEQEESLAQMPVSLRRLRSGGCRVLSYGRDQQEATASAVLDLHRIRRAGFAAGASQVRWLLDGALRGLTDRAMPVDDLLPHPNPEILRLQNSDSALAQPIRTELHRVPGLSWVLAHCIDGRGSRAAAWGPDSHEAILRAHRRASAARSFGDQGAALLGSVDTDALTAATPEQISGLAQELATWLLAHRVQLIGRPALGDPFVAAAPVLSGSISLEPLAADAPALADPDPMAALSDELTERTRAHVVTTLGWDHDHLRQAFEQARDTGTPVLPVQLAAEQIVIGPLWSAEQEGGCPACAETRRRTVADHVLVADLRSATLASGRPAASLLTLASHVVNNGPAPAPGQVLVISTEGVSRHRIIRLPACPWCSSAPGEQPPAAPERHDQPTDPTDPTRVAQGTPLLREEELSERVVDATYGPVRGILREERMPFAMSMAVLAGAPVMGHGRALRYEQTRSVAVLEAYERLAGFPYEAPLVRDRSFADLGAVAVDPMSLGRYSRRQLDHPTSKVIPLEASTPLDWAWGVDLRDGRNRLVPAEIGFYQYDHQFKRDRRASEAASAAERRRFFLESSSGCALGSSWTEASIHALFEVAERDAFQLAWHAGKPLPSIPVQDLEDPVIRQLVALIEARGFDVHLLVPQTDIVVPVVWVLATSSTGVFPVSFSSAGSGAVPQDAVRAGLREVAQLVTMELDWDEAEAEALVGDPWLVTELEDHVRHSSAPSRLNRIRQVLGGPTVSLADAFPGWPQALVHPTGGINGTLSLLHERFIDAGLEEIILVDQSTVEHRDLGLHVVKAVVPGAVPMVFGHAHQRLQGLPRLQRVLDAAGVHLEDLDPHPFP